MFDKTTLKQLKTVLMDFYSVEVLSYAVNDIHELKSLGLPHIPRRRDGENRAAGEIDDIISIFSKLDENKQLDQLPRYVAVGPDSMHVTPI